MTPTTSHLGALPARITGMGLVADAGLARGSATPGAPPSRWANVLEWLEDAVLLLLIVFSVPVVIVLLALPFALIIRIAEGIAQRW